MGSDEYEKLSGDEYRKFRVGNFGCYSCSSRCGKIHHVPNGPYAGAQSEGPEYESIWAFSSPMDNTNIEATIRADQLCDDYGMDTITTGNSIGFAYELYEKGILTRQDTDGLELTYGNHAAMIELINKIGRREGIGDVLAEGVMRAAATIGKGAESYAIHVKGMEPPAYDPRGAKCLGFNYATSNIGASHGYGYAPQEVFGSPIPRQVDRFAEEENADIVIFNQNGRAARSFRGRPLVFQFFADHKDMPRKARIDAAGTLHHIMGRGIDRSVIFRNGRDRDDFIRRLSAILRETRTRCYAWVLLPNHFHLLLKTGFVPIAQVMRRLLTGYAVSHNRRHGRTGHLFQNRYKSILCDEEAYFLELVRYVHLNPVRTGLVKDMQALDAYRYGGHSAIVGKQIRNWQDTEAVLRFFSAKRSVARQRYRRFVEKGLNQGRRDDLTGGGLIRSAGGWSPAQALRRQHAIQKSDERLLGNGAFVERVLKEAEERMERRLRLEARGVTIDTLMRRVCEVVGCTEQEVVKSGKERTIVRARSLLCYWAVRELGLPQTDLARMLHLSPEGISLSVKRGEALTEELGCVLLGASAKLEN